MSDLWYWPPLIPFTETLSFLTDIQVAELAESRTATRHARSVYDMRHLVDDVENLVAEGVFNENRVGEFRVPAWGEATEFDWPLPPGMTVLTVHDADWRAGSEAFLRGPAGQVETIVISAVGGGTITLFSATTIPVAFAMPLRVAKPLAALTGTRIEPGLSLRQTQFGTQDNQDLGAHDFAEIDGLMVLDDATLIGVEQAMQHPDETVDSGFGGITIIPLRPGVNHRMGIGFLDDGAAAIWRRRQFWHALRGRSTEFWLPSFAADLRLTEALDAADLTARVAAPAWAASLLVDRVLVLDDGGARVARKATAVTVDGGDWVVDLSAAPGRAIGTAAQVSIARRVRLDQDDIVMTFLRQGLMRSSAVCVGVP